MTQEGDELTTKHATVAMTEEMVNGFHRELCCGEAEHNDAPRGT